MNLRRLKPLSMDTLNRGLARVWRELGSFGFTCKRLDSCQVYLGVIGAAYGYQWFGERPEGRACGDIILPRVSFSHWGDVLFGQRRVAVLDILRHEYGHAYADVNRSRIESKRFEKAFGFPHDLWEGPRNEYDPDIHVSTYAATNPGEDFAEVFMLFLKLKGKLPTRLDTNPIRRKWKFVEDLSR